MVQDAPRQTPWKEAQVDEKPGRSFHDIILWHAGDDVESLLSRSTAGLWLPFALPVRSRVGECWSPSAPLRSWRPARLLSVAPARQSVRSVSRPIGLLLCLPVRRP
jgi:hypothetical protein